METKKFTQQGWKIVLVVTLFIANFSSSQSCDSITPFFQADLTAAPNATWTSPLIARDGNCCGTTAPDKCIEFEITLHPDALSINFEISSGAVPPGALYYQIDCGPQIQVGEPICLDGVGPHNLTFCKPGNNANTFTITSYPEPNPGPDIILNTGCTNFIYANYYDKSTITWKSIFPGESIGDYNDYLDCLVGCDTVNVAPTTTSPPPFVDFEVCGYDQAGCLVDPICFVVRVNFIPQLTTQASPNEVHLCFETPTAEVTAITQNGIPPYSYLWSDGQTTQTVELGPGTHIVEVMDSSQCIVVTDTVVITQDELPITANAGADAEYCALENLSIPLNGTIQTATGGIWSGGLGVLSPNNTTLNASYEPTQTELENGSVTLTLTTTGNNGCPPASDEVQLNFYTFSSEIILDISHVTCYGLADGFASVEVNGDFAPFQYSWNGEPLSFSANYTDLSHGSYSLLIMNDLGCDTTLYFEIEEPEVLDLSLVLLEHVTCYGDETGSIQLTSQGGTMPYAYAWEELPSHTTSSAENLGADSYTVHVTDANNCVDSITLDITQPNELTVDFINEEPSCFNGDNGSIVSEVNGGVEPYSYDWSSGQVTPAIEELVSANYILTVTDENGCTLVSNLFLDQPTPVQASITGTSVICPNEETTIVISAEGGTGDYTYDWSPGGQTSDTIVVYPGSSQYFSGLVTDENNCSVLLTTSVIVLQINQDDLSASIAPSEICFGDSTAIIAEYSGDDLETITLNWLHCGNCNPNTLLYEHPLEDTYYIVSATNICGQVIYDTVFVTVNPLPVIELDPNLGEACPGEYIVFQNLADDNENWDYLWDFGDGNVSTLMNPAHNYSYSNTYFVVLTVTDENGCQSITDGNSYVEIFPQAVADFGLSNNDIEMLDPTVTFFNYSTNADNYFWEFGDDNISFDTQPTHTYSGHGNYVITLNANNAYNCPDTAQIAINVKPSHGIFVPNAFTPDGDDYNNVFSAQGFGISDQGFKLLIFNRWGEVLFESYDMSVGWSGTYGSHPEIVKEGVYIWVIEYKDLTEKTHKIEGHVALLK
jgi:gliding motility-associated-like protein